MCELADEVENQILRAIMSSGSMGQYGQRTEYVRDPLLQTFSSFAKIISTSYLVAMVT